jgi:regulatory protein
MQSTIEALSMSWQLFTLRHIMAYVSSGSSRRHTAPAKPYDLTRLERVALHYLERYSASEAGVRRVLERRVARAETQGAAHDTAQVQEWIETILNRCRGLGYVDDVRYSQQQYSALRRAGRSASWIRQKLLAKGLNRDIIDTLFADTPPDDDGQDPELTAARRMAQRKHLGPWAKEGRHHADPQEIRVQKQKDLASLLRAGFRLDVARRALTEGD